MLFEPCFLAIRGSMRSCLTGHRWQCDTTIIQGGLCTTFEHSSIQRSSVRNSHRSSLNTALAQSSRSRLQSAQSAPGLYRQSSAQSSITSSAQSATRQSAQLDTDFDSEGEGDMCAEELKSILLDSLYGTERGLNASNEVRSEISELLTQLEAKNPTPAPTEAIDKLSGKWKLVYTASSELTGLLGLNRLPGIEVGDITQTINARTLSAVNTVSIQGFGSRTSVSAKAALEIQTPKRVQVRFESTIIESPEVVTDAELPSNISFLGQSVDLTNLKESLAPATAYAQNKAVRLSNFLQKQRNLVIAIPGGRGAQSWLLTTYLDDELRISRGNNGAIFVLVKDDGVTPEAL